MIYPTKDENFDLNVWNGNFKEMEDFKNNMKPLVLSAENVEQYLNDATFGDEALNAILSGRQILVRTPNADGGKHTAIYSPIYMYQLPNFENNYLYLFYLRDEKQDLTSIIGYPIQMPVYGELKLLLSETYNNSPL